MKLTVYINNKPHLVDATKRNLEATIKSVITSMPGELTWRDANIFIPHYPGKGRSLAKIPGYMSMCGGG